jgi:Zn-dependent protease
MLFNLLPLAPLDGEKIAAYAWPPSWAAVLERIQRFGPVILMFLFISGSFLPVDIIGEIIRPPLTNILRLMLGAPLL